MGTSTPEYPLDELRIGRVFTHKQMTSHQTTGPLHCRIVGWDDEKVTYDDVYFNTDGSERFSRWEWTHESFFGECLGAWVEGDAVPRPKKREGLSLPLTAKKEGTSGPGRG